MNKMLFIVVASTFAASPILAQSGPGPRLSDACRAEVKNLCGASQDKAARRACMKENRSKISDGCRTEIKSRMEAHKASRPQAEAQ